MPLFSSLGLGNAVQGGGISLSAGFKGREWDLAVQGLGWRDSHQANRTRLDRFHLWFRGKGGWQLGLEREPLTWGYGLNGGYLLGTASQPVPKFRVQSPFKAVHLFAVPLGTWRGEVFLGQMDNRQPVSSFVQDYSYRIRAAKSYNPQRPFLSGIRAEARFGDAMEFYLNWINLFGGTINGRSLTEGYNASEWATAFFGAKDTLAEGSLDFSNPNGPPGVYKNKARSGSNSDVGARIRLSFFEQLLQAQDVRVYASKGSKAVNSYFGTLLHRPLHYLGKDLREDLANLQPGRLYETYDQRTRYSAPSADVPNNSLGLLVAWPEFKLGLEALDTANAFIQDGRGLEAGHRSFEHGSYRTGFYYDGDPLGNAFGGETRSYTLYGELESARWASRWWLYFGNRPFRDELSDWLLDHPGGTPATNRFVGVQGEVHYRPDPSQEWRLGFEIQGQKAFRYVAGDFRKDARGYLAWRWISGR